MSIIKTPPITTKYIFISLPIYILVIILLPNSAMNIGVGITIAYIASYLILNCWEKNK